MLSDEARWSGEKGVGELVKRKTQLFPSRSVQTDGRSGPRFQKRHIGSRMHADTQTKNNSLKYSALWATENRSWGGQSI